MTRRRSELGCAALAAGIMFCSQAQAQAQAQDYPNKPIRMINPFSPGGGTDIAARAIGQKMYETWGQLVVVDNRAGAGGNIGMETVARAPADGYTVLLTSGSFITNPLVYAKVQYEPLKDFAPVSVVAYGAQVLVAHPSVDARNVKELVALAKARPGSLSLGTPGIGSVGHLTTELLKTTAGINIVHVPYKGSGAAITDVLGGQIQLMIAGPSSVVQHVKAGKLRSLALASPKREAGLPDIPTFAESGFPEVEATNWYGILMVAGTPKPVLDKFHRELVRIMELPEIKERFSKSGFEAAHNTPAEFARFLAQEQVKWRKVVKASGARVD